MDNYSVVVSEGVYKTFKKTIALENISFQVERSELFGFIGPDGAGKTTLFRIITSLMLPDEGFMSVFGLNSNKDFKKIRKKIGYMPGRFSLYQDLTVEENLSFFASIFGSTIQKNYDLIKDIYIQIEPFKRRKAGNLSGGMKQKLALCCALIHKPELLILDEPTTGVDAVSRVEFWEMLKNLKNQGITIIVSTPYMDEASLCERIALISQGKILTIDKPETIVNQSTKKIISIKSDSKYKLQSALRRYKQCFSAFPFGDVVHYTDIESKPDIKALTDYLGNLDINIIRIQEIKPSIEDLFMELMVK